MQGGHFCRQDHDEYICGFFLCRQLLHCHSQGFEDKNLGSSSGLLGQKVATVAAHQPGELPKLFLTCSIGRWADTVATGQPIW